MTIDIKQYLKETNCVLLTEQAYKYLKEKASVIEKLEEIKSDMYIIAELEAIKAEIEKEREERASVKDWGRYYGLNLSLEIIDNHISELKGETKCE